MPELPEVETVRRNLEATVVGRTIGSVRLSGKKLRDPISRQLPHRLRGRRIESVERHGKFLLIHLDQDLTLISHLGMSGRWLFFDETQDEMLHVHAWIRFKDAPQQVGLQSAGLVHAVLARFRCDCARLMDRPRHFSHFR